MTTTSINEDKLNALVGRAIDDFGAIISSALMRIGDKLDLYRTLKRLGPVTTQALADATGTQERYIRPWLINQAAAGYVDYDASTQRYSLSPEQAMVLADDDTPYSMAGGFELLTSIIKDEPHITEAMRSGGGMLWGDHDEGLFTGTARFFKPGYVGNIVQNWLPALDGVVEKLQAGGIVADQGCGYGTSTIIMAQAFPNSRFIGFDNHAPSIESARKAAEEAGVADRCTFEVGTAQDFPGSDYDLVTFFDCLHDMGDPAGAARRAREALKPGGAVMLVEPMAGENAEDNFNVVGRLFSAASVLVCTPHAVAEGGNAIGTIATEAQLRSIFDGAGYASFRRATQSPTSRVFEARA